MSEKAIPGVDVRAVFTAWQAKRPRPDLCRLTADRDKLIRSRLALGYSVADLQALIAYVFDADDDWCRFMRGGNNRGKDYTGLDSILRKEKLGDRVERALLWKEGADQAAARQRKLEATGVDLGFMGLLKQRPEA